MWALKNGAAPNVIGNVLATSLGAKSLKKFPNFWVLRLCALPANCVYNVLHSGDFTIVFVVHQSNNWVCLVEHSAQGIRKRHACVIVVFYEIVVKCVFSALCKTGNANDVLLLKILRRRINAVHLKTQP